MSDPIGPKVDHVREAGQTCGHVCHWPGCGRQVPPAMWGCKAHWFRLPQALRSRIWRTYRIGQEADGRPSRAYVEAAREVQDWIRAKTDVRDLVTHPSVVREVLEDHPADRVGKQMKLL